MRVAEKLEGEKLNVAEVNQSEIAQKLQTVLETPRSPPGASNGTWTVSKG